MEPHEDQQCFQHRFAGYFSSLLSQSHQHKVSTNDHVLEPWTRASMAQNLSFFDARNELENEDEFQPQHQWRSHTTAQPQLSVHNRYDYQDYFNVVPSMHVSTSNLCGSLVSSSLDLNLQVAADMVGAPTPEYISSSNHSLYHSIGILESPRNSSNSNITISSENGGGRTKKTGHFSEDKFSNHHSEPKKLRIMPRSSCPPLKVRKEKLGDRIAALQRLVAPYGKTDTASVLTEAIGYIQFLHHQIQTLSVPYMESSNIKSTRKMQSDLSGKIESKRDLRSRGLSLVPLSYASCFNSYN